MKNFIFAFLIALLAPHPVQAKDKQETVYERINRTGVIRCGYAPWPMYWNVDPVTKELSGINKDISDAVFNLLGLKAEYVEYTFSNKVVDLQSGKLDAICGDGPWILSTIRQQDYTTPLFYTPVYTYVRMDETRFKTPADLNKEGVTFVGIDGDLSTDLVTHHFPKAKLDTLASTVDASEMLLNVSTHKQDAVIIDPGAATNFIKNNPGKVKILGTKPFGAYLNSFGVAKGQVDLLNMLNGAVEALQNTGGVDPILDQWDPKHELFLRVAPNYISQK